MADDKLMHHVIPVGFLEDRQVAEVVLQPPSLRLVKIKRNKNFDICLLQSSTYMSPETLGNIKRDKSSSHLSCCQHDRAQKCHDPVCPKVSDHQQSKNLQQYDVAQVEDEEQRPGSKHPLALGLHI